jgi:hypothetical protein
LRALQLDFAIQDDSKMRSSETCRQLAEQMLADAQREPKRNELLLRAAHAWLELANTLKRTEVVSAADPLIISTPSRPQPGPIEAEIDGAAFIARW